MKKLFFTLAVIALVLPMTFIGCSSDHEAGYTQAQLEALTKKDSTSTTPTPPTTPQEKPTTPTDGTLNFTASATVIKQGGSITFSDENATYSANPTDIISFNKNIATVSESATLGKVTITARKENATGGTDTGTLEITIISKDVVPVNGTLSFTASPTIVKQGGTITMSDEDATYTATGISFIKNIGTVADDCTVGTVTITGTKSNATGGTDTGTLEITIQVKDVIITPTDGTLNFTASATVIKQGGSITFSDENATYSANPTDIISFNKNIATVSESATLGKVTITARKENATGGTDTGTLEITIISKDVVPVNGTLSFTASPTIVKQGGTITMSDEDATYTATGISFIKNIGTVADDCTVGTVTITGTKSNATGGTDTGSFDITIEQGPKDGTLSFTASPTSVKQGGTVTMSDEDATYSATGISFIKNIGTVADDCTVGTVTITGTKSNATGGTDTGSFDITVTKAFAAKTITIGQGGAKGFTLADLHAATITAATVDSSTTALEHTSGVLTVDNNAVTLTSCHVDSSTTVDITLTATATTGYTDGTIVVQATIKDGSNISLKITQALNEDASVYMLKMFQQGDQSINTYALATQGVLSPEGSDFITVDKVEWGSDVSGWTVGDAPTKADSTKGWAFTASVSASQKLAVNSIPVWCKITLTPKSGKTVTLKSIADAYGISDKTTSAKTVVKIGNSQSINVLENNSTAGFTKDLDTPIALDAGGTVIEIAIVIVTEKSTSSCKFGLKNLTMTFDVN